jgi:GT2 family glycosyltransferase
MPLDSRDGESSTLKQRPRCAIVIPTFNGAHLLRICLKALHEHAPSEFEWKVFVVDDASIDGTRETLNSYESTVELVVLEQNSGFATASNAGAAAASDWGCELMLFLNNDTIPTAGWSDALVSHVLRTPEAAAVGAKLLYPDGSIQHAGVTIGQDGWPRHLYTGFPTEHPAVNRTRRVAAVTAACMLIRRDDFECAGGFDPAFHNGFEDVDLCLRLTDRGREVWYCPDSVVYHLESVTRWPTGQPQDTDRNERLFAERWLGRIASDDIQHYLDDGLLGVEYGPCYPVTFSVSPDLGAVRRDSEEVLGVDRMLRERSRQVMDHLATRTRALLAEGSFDSSPGGKAVDSTPGRIVVVGTRQSLGSANGGHLVSLLLPVKNQERDVHELLPLLLGQSVSVELEVVAVDSGSSDGTVQALRDFGATVIGIDQGDFDHGLSRNLAAQHAHGDILLFLSGRSRPVGDRWLAPLIATLDDDPQAAGVCSRVIPPPDADILTTKNGSSELSSAAMTERKVIHDWDAYRQMSVEQRREFLNFHTVGTVIRAEVFNNIPFRSVPTLGEDLLWAREVLEAGWALWHQAASLVQHAHDYTLAERFARNVDDGVANHEINGRTVAEAQVISNVRALVADDWAYLHDTMGLEGEELDHWKLESVLRRIAEMTGQWVGANHRELPADTATYFSGVSRARRST